MHGLRCGCILHVILPSDAFHFVLWEFKFPSCLRYKVHSLQWVLGLASDLLLVLHARKMSKGSYLGSTKCSSAPSSLWISELRSFRLSRANLRNTLYLRKLISSGRAYWLVNWKPPASSPKWSAKAHLVLMLPHLPISMIKIPRYLNTIKISKSNNFKSVMFLKRIFLFLSTLAKCLCFNHRD